MAEVEKAGEEAAEEHGSDLTDVPLPVAMRRAAASDDDEEDEDGGGSASGSPLPSTVFDSDSDPDGQGAAEFYDNDADEFYGTEAGSEAGSGAGEAEGVTDNVAVAPEDEGKYEDEEEVAAKWEEKEEEVKKGSEPCAVPTAGAFYEHENRFQSQEDSSRGYQRQIFGVPKIWYPKEEAVWVHDRFNEINFHDNRHDNFQLHSYYGDAKGYKDEPNYRERGSRTYQSHLLTSAIPSAQNNSRSYYRSQNAKVSSNAGAGKHSSQSLQHGQTLPCNQTFGSNTAFLKARAQHEQTLPCKQTLRSNISSAPLPSLYSSRSSHQGLPFIQTEKARHVTFSKLFTSAVHKAHNSLTPQSHPSLRKKAFVPYASGEHGANVAFHRIVPIDVMPRSALHRMSTSHKYHEYSKAWNQGRNLNIAEPTRPCTQPQKALYQQKSVQPPILHTPRASVQVFVQKASNAKKIQSNLQTTIVSSSDDGEVTAPPEPYSSVVLSAVTGQGDMKEAVRTCVLDGGSLILCDTRARGCTLDDSGSSNIPVNSLQPSESSLASPRENGATEDSISLTFQDPISLTSQEIPEFVGREFVRHRNRTRRYLEMSFAL